MYDYLVRDRFDPEVYQLWECSAQIIVCTLLSVFFRAANDHYLVFPLSPLSLGSFIFLFLAMILVVCQMALGKEYVVYKRKQQKDKEENYREEIIKEVIKRLRAEARKKEDPESTNRFYDVYKESKSDKIDTPVCKTCGHYIANCICREES